MMGHQTITAEAATTHPTTNVVLLRQVLAHIEQHPKTWVQKEWRCRTGMCFAGWAADLSGGRWATDADHWLSRYLTPEADDRPDDVVERDEIGSVVDVEDRAKRVLGLDMRQADSLFHGGNDLSDIRDAVTELAAEVHHVTVRIVPDSELVLGERMPDGRSPLEIVEHRPDDQPMFHGGERGIPAHRLRDHARDVADRLGVPYIDPIDPAAMERLTRAEAA
ncbi:SGNH/GDSL hydrolase family protein [Nonomuraea sp. NPDC023979]|uniref:SGNH/GDSL hydrolase family protein n=1 Tax=Nonomuraea sp. NPDC023979 TaxID=3154796 RepID=UPI0033D6ABD9